MEEKRSPHRPSVVVEQSADTTVASEPDPAHLFLLCFTHVGCYDKNTVRNIINTHRKGFMQSVKLISEVYVPRNIQKTIDGRPVQVLL